MGFFKKNLAELMISLWSMVGEPLNEPTFYALEIVAYFLFCYCWCLLPPPQTVNYKVILNAKSHCWTDRLSNFYFCFCIEQNNDFDTILSLRVFFLRTSFFKFLFLIIQVIIKTSSVAKDLLLSFCCEKTEWL